MLLFSNSCNIFYQIFTVYVFNFCSRLENTKNMNKNYSKIYTKWILLSYNLQHVAMKSQKENPATPKG